MKVTTVVHVPFLRPEASDFDFFAYEEFNLEIAGSGTLIVRPKKKPDSYCRIYPAGQWLRVWTEELVGYDSKILRA